MPPSDLSDRGLYAIRLAPSIVVTGGVDVPLDKSGVAARDGSAEIVGSDREGSAASGLFSDFAGMSLGCVTPNFLPLPFPLAVFFG